MFSFGFLFQVRIISLNPNGTTRLEYRKAPLQMLIISMLNEKATAQ